MKAVTTVVSHPSISTVHIITLALAVVGGTLSDPPIVFTTLDEALSHELSILLLLFSSGLNHISRVWIFVLVPLMDCSRQPKLSEADKSSPVP